MSVKIIALKLKYLSKKLRHIFLAYMDVQSLFTFECFSDHLQFCRKLMGPSSFSGDLFNGHTIRMSHRQNGNDNEPVK